MLSKKKTFRRLAEVRRSVEDFLADEDGFVSKETILKTGLVTMAGIGSLYFQDVVQGQHENCYSDSPGGSYTRGLVQGCASTQALTLNSTRGCFDLNSHASAMVESVVVSCY